MLGPVQGTGFPGGSDGKESAYNAGDLPGFSPWVRKIPWSREWQPTPVFVPGEFHGQTMGSHGVRLRQKKELNNKTRTKTLWTEI